MPSFKKSSPDAKAELVHKTKMEPPKAPAAAAPEHKPADFSKPKPQAVKPNESKPQER